MLINPEYAQPRERPSRAAAAADGWTVVGDLGRWHFRLYSVPGGVRISATAPGGGAPAVWLVSG
jgi:hypothetical protein